MERVVLKSVELKMAVMSDDLDADYDETLKQYGHAVGHAVEHLSGGEVYHGEAISIGMCVSAEISQIMGICDAELVENHYKIFRSLELPTTIPPQFSHSDLWEKIRYDKHFANGYLNLGLLKTAGVLAKSTNESYTHSVSKEIFYKAVEHNRGTEDS